MTCTTRVPQSTLRSYLLKHPVFIPTILDWSSKSQLFSTKYSRLNLQKRLQFSRLCVKIWNKIPNEFKTLSKNSFEKQIKTSLFQILYWRLLSWRRKYDSSKLEDCTIETNWSSSIQFAPILYWYNYRCI